MGNKFSRALGHLILNIMGWKFEGNFPDRRKFVVIVAPHTSNWDFVVGMSTLLAAGAKVHWLGKHTIFKRPFRRLLRSMGGIPIDRRSSRGSVDSVIELFGKKDQFSVGRSPEGSREKVT